MVGVASGIVTFGKLDRYAADDPPVTGGRPLLKMPDHWLPLAALSIVGMITSPSERSWRLVKYNKAPRTGVDDSVGVFKGSVLYDFVVLFGLCTAASGRWYHRRHVVAIALYSAGEMGDAVVAQRRRRYCLEYVLAKGGGRRGHDAAGELGPGRVHGLQFVSRFV